MAYAHRQHYVTEHNLGVNLFLLSDYAVACVAAYAGHQADQVDDVNSLNEVASVEQVYLLGLCPEWACSC